ncbi:MAG: hypothetical protein ABEJ62_00445 [Candidatus Nanohaloarchaea archaeon]
MRRSLLPLLLVLFAASAAAGTPSLNVDSSSQTCPSGSASYLLQVDNPGPASDSYTVSVDAPWETVTLSEERIQLDSGGSETVYIWIQAPKGAEPGEYSSTVTVASSNTGDRAVKNLGVDVLSCRSVTLEAEDPSKDSCLYSEEKYTLHVRNTGQVSETYSLSATAGELSREEVELDAGESRELELDISSREPVNRTVTVKAESTTSYASDTVELEFSARKCRGVEVDLSPGSTRICNTENSSVNARMTNTGSVPENYTLEILNSTRTILLEPGETYTREAVLSPSSTANVTGRAYADGHPEINDSDTSTVEVRNCYGLDVSPETEGLIDLKANRTLVRLHITNTGTSNNTYNLLMDGPEWVDVRPSKIALGPGESRTAYMYVAPDFFGSGTYTPVMVVDSGEGSLRRTIEVNMTVENGTVSVRLPGHGTPTGGVVTSTSGLVAVLLTFVLLLTGGYIYFYRNLDDSKDS